MPGAARAVHRDHVDSRNSPAKIRQAKGAAPRFSTSLCPVSILESAHYKSTANNERLAIASLFPRPTSSVMHTRADCATSFAPRDLRDRAPAPPPTAARSGRAIHASAGCFDPYHRFQTNTVSGAYRNDDAGTRPLD